MSLSVILVPFIVSLAQPFLSSVFLFLHFLRCHFSGLQKITVGLPSPVSLVCKTPLLFVGNLPTSFIGGF